MMTIILFATEVICWFSEKQCDGVKLNLQLPEA